MKSRYRYFTVNTRRNNSTFVFGTLQLHKIMRRRVTRCLTRLQTLCNALKYRKKRLNGALRLRCGCVYVFNLLKASTIATLFLFTIVLHKSYSTPSRWFIDLQSQCFVKTAQFTKLHAIIDISYLIMFWSRALFECCT